MPFFSSSGLVRTVALLGVLAAAPAFGQSRRAMSMGHRPPPRPEKPQKDTAGELQKFSKMTPAERQQHLAKLPADRKEKLEAQLKKYESMTPAQKARLDSFNQLSPAQRSEFRTSFQRLQDQPADRRRAMREELNQLYTLPSDARKNRLNSPEFRSRYSPEEREIISKMAPPIPAK